MSRSFIDLADAGTTGLTLMLDEAIARKQARKGLPKGRIDADAPLAGHTLAMIFEKNSTRTRVSFDMAMRQLGGTTIVMDSGSMQLGRGETIADTARVLSRYVDAIMIRTDDPAKLEELAAHATVPVINGLTDRSHPCQIVADLLTAVEKGISLPGSKWAWLGDGNNVLHSIVEAAGLFKFSVAVGSPEGYDPDDSFVREANARLGDTNARVTVERSGPCRGRCGRGCDRHLGVDGPGGFGRQGRRHDTLPGQLRTDGACQVRRDLPALPARASRRGGDRRHPGRKSVRHLGRGGKPPTCTKSDFALVLWTDPQ
jgi:ornithine carbamoyltransferase